MRLSDIDRSYERLVDQGRVGIRYRPGTTQPELWSAGEGSPPYKERIMDSPTVGRLLHYSEVEGDHLAAVVVGVNEDGTVNLAYWTATGGGRSAQSVDIGDEVGQAHWPERS
jgi:hypothetical protein